MIDFIMEYIMPIFLVIFLTMAVIVAGMLIFKMANTETYTTKVIISENYINSEVIDVK